MKITNISKGPKSIWSAPVKGMVFIPAGVTVDVEIDDAEREAANPEWFSFERVEKPAETEHVAPDVHRNDPEPDTSSRPRGRPRKDS